MDRGQCRLCRTPSRSSTAVRGLEHRVAENHPNLLETYLGYGQGTQHSNTIRYLILYKISPPGLPVGINNAFITATHGHPFLKHTVDSIKRFNLSRISLHVTDMFSAGCHYISTIHATHSHHSNLRVLPREYKLGVIPLPRSSDIWGLLRGITEVLLRLNY
ncbi:hypothetical protein BDM02DRAFT_2419524 [Thelephora ganbajun]|uniref:Uncharacterized protein n=1 Tax=Thelephora ganbajun TaxID=370292 RepID=A0ACB6ZU67_THEGA|nr:hypothetical protein BDM02DRAFT_2419524 [Thelephora ganbajun]